MVGNFGWVITAPMFFMGGFFLCAFVWNEMWSEALFLVMNLVVVAGVVVLGHKKATGEVTQRADRPHLALTTTGLRYDNESVRFGVTVFTTVLVRVLLTTSLCFCCIHSLPPPPHAPIIVFTTGMKPGPLRRNQTCPTQAQ
jgi:hypothetical protein